MGGAGDACPICSTPYDTPAADAVADLSGIHRTAVDSTALDGSTAAAIDRAVPPARSEPDVVERTLVGAGAPSPAAASAPTAAAAAATAVGPPPPHRPDPYAQISNPLHTNWGAPPAAPAAQPMPIAPPTPVRRRSPWLRRVTILLVLALVAGAAWLQRDRITDVIEDARDRVSADGDADAAAPVVPAAPAAPDPTRAYLDWEQANESNLVPLIKEWQATSDALDATGADLNASRGELTRSRDAVQQLAILVDGAPDSQIRSDILSMLLNFMASYDDLVRLIDSGEEAYYDTAIERLDAVIADEQRFAATHGTESIFLG
jgi:translation initiation factor IF-2